MAHINIIVLCVLIFLAAIPAWCQNECGLKSTLEGIVNDFSGDVGIAVICGQDTVCINGDIHFPMFSVVKFHQSLAVCECMRNGNCPHDINVTAEDLKPDTWSPMREKYPGGGRFSPNELMEYTLIESDNNACDILFNHISSPAKVEEYTHSLGITDCGIAWTEDDQHADISRCYDNWTTPLAAAQLLGKFYEGRNSDEYFCFVWDTMANCQTGANRIPKYIASSADCIVHKTGTGGMLPDGGVMGINDIACIILPDGRHFELAVFIKDANFPPAACEELIAQVAKVCYETVLL